MSARVMFRYNDELIITSVSEFLKNLQPFSCIWKKGLYPKYLRFSAVEVFAQTLSNGAFQPMTPDENKKLLSEVSQALTRLRADCRRNSYLEENINTEGIYFLQDLLTRYSDRRLATSIRQHINNLFARDALRLRAIAAAEAARAATEKAEAAAEVEAEAAVAAIADVVPQEDQEFFNSMLHADFTEPALLSPWPLPLPSSFGWLIDQSDFDEDINNDVSSMLHSLTVMPLEMPPLIWSVPTVDVVTGENIMDDAFDLDSVSENNNEDWLDIEGSEKFPKPRQLVLHKMRPMLSLKKTKL